MGERIDAYAVLQVVPTAHPDVIRAAYRALARNYHPDRSTDPTDAHRMIELNAAFELVGTAARRAAYDLASELAADDYAGAEPDQAPAKRRGAGGAAGRGPKARGRGRETSEPTGPAAEARSSGSEPRATTDASPQAPPPSGPAVGSVLDFGRYKGWSLGQIARVDSNYLEWFRRTTIGRRYQAEIEDLLEPVYAAATPPPEPSRSVAAARRGWLRRRG